MDWPDFFERAVPPTIGALIGALVAGYFVPKHYYRQRWWDRKADAYTGLIGHLASMEHAYDKWLDEELGFGKIPPDNDRELEALHKGAFLELSRARNIGAFTLHPDAQTVLNTLFQELNGNRQFSQASWIDAIQRNQSALRTAIEELKRIGKQDLQIKS